MSPLRVFTSILDDQSKIDIPHFRGPKVIGRLASQRFLISQVCSIAALVRVKERFQYPVLILCFLLPLESDIGICKNMRVYHCPNTYGLHCILCFGAEPPPDPTQKEAGIDVSNPPYRNTKGGCSEYLALYKPP